MSAEPSTAPIGGGAFPLTQWTRIIEVAHTGDPDASKRVLEAFCLEYLDAIRAFLMRRGCSESDAQDVAHDFLYQHVLLKWDQSDSLVHRARREAGHRFRSFLCSALMHFLTDRQRAGAAQKRGGGRVESLDAVTETGAQVADPGSGIGAWERQFDASYAVTVLRRAAGSLRHCEQNLALLTRQKTQADVAAELGMTENAVKQMHHQFRRRLGEAVRAEVERTVGPNPGEVDEELRYLMSLFGGPS